jgi:hypothetical protein
MFMMRYLGAYLRLRGGAWVHEAKTSYKEGKLMDAPLPLLR